MLNLPKTSLIVSGSIAIVNSFAIFQWPLKGEKLQEPNWQSIWVEFPAIGEFTDPLKRFQP